MTLEKSLPHVKPQFPHKPWGEGRESYYCSTYTTGCYEHLKELIGQCTFVQDWGNATCWHRHSLYTNRKVNPLSITSYGRKDYCGNTYLNHFSHMACSHCTKVHLVTPWVTRSLSLYISINFTSWEQKAEINSNPNVICDSSREGASKTITSCRNLEWRGDFYHSTFKLQLSACF